MKHYLYLLAVMLLPVPAAHADLILEQKFGDTNDMVITILKIHGDQMRIDQPTEHFAVIIDMKSRDAITLFTNIKKYLKRSGADAQKALAARQAAGRPDDMDAAPAAPLDTGKSEVVDNFPAEKYTWAGAHGMAMTLWVATNFPNFSLIRPELAKLDRFNQFGTHPNAQPLLGNLPGMVVKSETTIKGHKTFTSLVRVNVEPVDPQWFEMPTNYDLYESPKGVGP